MSVAMTNCGRVADHDMHGYLYAPDDPLTGQRWPSMPARSFVNWLRRRRLPAAILILPDACLINRYQPGAKLSLHQDKDERDLRAPIVSVVSLGLPAAFQFGGLRRSDIAARAAGAWRMWWSGGRIVTTTVSSR